MEDKKKKKREREREYRRKRFGRSGRDLLVALVLGGLRDQPALDRPRLALQEDLESPLAGLHALHPASVSTTYIQTEKKNKRNTEGGRKRGWR
jgi:hypothetical protein